MSASPLAWTWAGLAVLVTSFEVGALELGSPGFASALWGAHLTHLSGAQLLMAGGVSLLLLIALERRYGSRALALGASVIGLGVSAVVLLAEPSGIATYAGSSGLAHGLGAWWLLGRIESREGLSRWCVAGAALLVLKVTAELVTGNVAGAVGLGSGGVPVPISHAAGAACGALVALAHGSIAKREDARPTERGAGAVQLKREQGGCVRSS